MSRFGGGNPLGRLMAFAAVMALATPLCAQDTYHWITPGGSILDSANWSPAGGPPVNGDIGIIGGGASSITAWVPSHHPGNVASSEANPIRLHGMGQTPPSAIRVLQNGILELNSSADVGELNLVLQGGELRVASGTGRYWASISLIGEGSIRNNVELRRPVLDGDASNPGILVFEAGGRTTLNMDLSAGHSTHTGGTIIRSGADVYERSHTTGTAYVGVFGYGDLVLEAGSKMETRNRSSLFAAGSGAKIHVYDGAEIMFHQNNYDNVVAYHGAILTQTNFASNKHANSVISVEGDVFMLRHNVASGQIVETTSTWNNTFVDGASAGRLIFRQNNTDVGLGSTEATILNASNTYSGGSVIERGRIIAAVAGALGTGDVLMLVHQDAILQLLHNDAINANASLTILDYLGRHGTVHLGNVDVTVRSLTLGDNDIANGTYSVGDSALGSFFTGTGTITVIPEPASALLLAGLGLLLARRRPAHR